ncbi:gamma-glutamyltransferase [Sphingomonas ginsenosidimutans]|jgi:gamma-glutamyltranspeptidase/glutathione hydrolase|uniref:Glutathione hydrolase proenzyme n=1 Tax=Sphingomonas ginsenosidimutans TaxID=862134 RepID=A0A2A4HVD1_9SPHN|nr:gamma-glutamyltransferase [Sphingomonas ginsenosidimutans]PCG08324.1 gamma-glutamyltransferase [Sphingomonas ginsenosidimutans]
MLRRLTVAALIAALPLMPVVAAQEEPPARAATPSGGDIVAYDQIHKPVVGRGGMVVSQNILAAQVGAQILRKGGNAVDAAVATGFALAVTLPRAGNVGGGGYMLVHMAARDGRPAQTIAIDYYGQASRNTTPDLLLDAAGKLDQAKVMSMKGVAIPGTVAGLWEAHRRFGSLPWGTLLAPAIAMAEKGVPLSEDEAKANGEQRRLMADDPAAMAMFFKPGGAAYAPGETFRQPDLAATLKAIAAGGADAFYRGPLAQELAAGIRAGGGIIDAADLAGYRAIVSEPIWSSYRGRRIAYMPPTASGVSVAEAMNILERFPVAEAKWGSVANLHLLSETMKIVSADRRLVGGAPDWQTPARGLASKEYAAQRAALIRPDRSLDARTLPDGNPYPFESKDTTHFSVVDAQGNAVSNTYTLSASYGAHVVAPGTGVLLNNSLGNLSWSRRGGGATRDATRPVPGKRVGSTITPLIVFRDDRPWLVTGTPGGGYIIATMVQLLSNVIDHGLNVAEAAERPRINQGGGDAPLELEGGFSPDIVPLLEAKGHRVRPSNTMGSIQSIMVEGDAFLGAADTRRPDAAAVPAR